jgi:Tudor domain
MMKNGLASLEDLKLHFETPCVGQAVLANSKAHQLSRCVVTKINSDSDTCEIFHVDFGDREVLPLESLFQIPEHYMKIRIMASSLKMSKLGELPNNIPKNIVKNVFAELIENDNGLSIEVDSGNDNQFSLQTVVVWNSKKNNILYEILEKLKQIDRRTRHISEPDKLPDDIPIEAAIDL